MVDDPNDFHASGLIVDKEDGHPVGPSSPSLKNKGGADYPKWVVPHASHVAHSGPEGLHVSTPAFPDFFIDRLGKVSVLVHDKDEESKAEDNVRAA